MKQTRIILAIGLVITLFYVFCSLQKTLPLERLELLFYDLRFQLRGKVTPPDNIVIVAIDDGSLAKVGRWPWERRKLAEIVDRLKEMGARVVLLDIICADPAPGDAEFGDAIRRAGTCFCPSFLRSRAERGLSKTKTLPDGLFP